MTTPSDRGVVPLALEAYGVTKRFGAFVALKGVDFVARQGEVTALVGPNGAGKTTLFHILDGNLRPDAGRVTLNGEDVTGLAPWRMARRGVGRLFQDVRVFNDLTARENISAALMSVGASAGEAEKWLAFAGIAEMADEKARILPPADRRLLAIARLLALKARLFLLDEPTASLPAEDAERVYGFVRKLVEEREASAVMVEHDKAAVCRFADSACFLHEGEVLCAGTAESVFADSRVRALYADGEESSLRASPGRVRFADSSAEVRDASGRLLPDVAYLREGRNVFPSLPVADNLALSGWSVPSADFEMRRKRALDLFPFLADRMEQRAGTLSGGQRQALALAMTMIRPAQVYFFDEPSAGLAPKTAAAMFAAIRQFAEDEPDCRVIVSERNLRSCGVRKGEGECLNLKEAEG